MPGLFATMTMFTSCFHQTGVVTCAPSNPSRVFVLGQPVATMADQFLVAGCLFALPGPTPHPCVRVQLQSAGRVKVNGVPVLLHTPATTMCLSADQAPQGI